MKILKILILLIFVAGCSYEKKTVDPNIREQVIDRLYRQNRTDNFWKESSEKWDEQFPKKKEPEK